MTTNDETLALLRQQIDHMEQAQAAQPERLAKGHAEADAARMEALAAEPWDDLWSAVPGYNADGELTGMMAIPSFYGKELFGTRLAFDLLGCCDDEDQVADTLNKYYAMVKDPAHLFLIAFAALEVIANYVVPDLLGVIEDKAGNWDVRVTLADAARNAWAARVNDIRSYGTDTTS